jgi:transcriptional regulator with XRE-family HTH domain
MPVTLGKQIRTLRTEKGLTQSELGRLLGKAGSTVRMWELDRSSPDRKALYAMCEIFGVTPDYFFYNTTPPESMDGSLKHSFEIKNRVAALIGKWTVFQAQKRLPILEALQDLSEDELMLVLDYIRYIQSKRKGEK